MEKQTGDHTNGWLCNNFHAQLRFCRALIDTREVRTSGFVIPGEMHQLIFEMPALISRLWVGILPGFFSVIGSAPWSMCDIDQLYCA